LTIVKDYSVHIHTGQTIIQSVLYRYHEYTGLKITVGHYALADQNLLMLDKIPAVVRHDIWTFFYCTHFTARMNKIPPKVNFTFFGGVRPQFVLSNQDDILVGHCFKREKLFAALIHS